MILQADARYIPLADNSVQCCVTSPPYWGLRDYGVSGQLGLERTPEEYVANMVAVFREVRRVLREDGTCWVNMGDSYATQRNDHEGGGFGSNKHSTAAKRGWHGGDDLKPKDLCGIPWRLAFALQADGWWLRSDIIWAKPNPMPESVTDRPTKSHEYIFLLTKSATYYFDQEAVKEPCNYPEGSWARSKCYDGDTTGKLKSFYGSGAQWKGAENRNLRSVWAIATQPYPEAHFATFPEAIPKRCILAGTSERGACSACGAPWERVVERKAMVIRRSNNHPPELRTRTSGTMLAPAESVTIGFRPTCTHTAHVRPCIVLDPFSGSGTTVAVAESLGRRGVGLELKAEYIALAKRRCQVTLGLPL